MAAADYPIPGKYFIVHSGDELRDIAQAASVFGQPITVHDILAANPGLDAGRLKVGRKILIPGAQANGDPAPAPDRPIPVPGNGSMPEAPADPAPSQQPPAEPEA